MAAKLHETGARSPRPGARQQRPVTPASTGDVQRRPARGDGGQVSLDGAASWAHGLGAGVQLTPDDGPATLQLKEGKNKDDKPKPVAGRVPTLKAKKSYKVKPRTKSIPNHGNPDKERSVAWYVAEIQALRLTGDLDPDQRVTLELQKGEFQVSRAIRLCSHLTLRGQGRGKKGTRLVWRQNTKKLKWPQRFERDQLAKDFKKQDKPKRWLADRIEAMDDWAEEHEWADVDNQCVLLGKERYFVEGAKGKVKEKVRGVKNLSIAALSVVGRQGDADRLRDIKAFVVDKLGKGSAKGFWNTKGDKDSDGSAKSARMTGIKVNGRGRGKKANIKVKGTKVSDCSRYGIGGGNGRGFTLADNVLEGNGSSDKFDHNAYFRSVDKIKVKGGRTSGAAGAGFKIAEAAGVNVDGLVAEENGTDGVRLANIRRRKGRGATVRNVESRDNGRDGLRISTEGKYEDKEGYADDDRWNEGIRVEDSTFEDNDLHGIESFAGKPEVTGNTFEDNKVDAWNHDGAAQEV